MTRPVTVYRWDDAGAPQLANGKPSEIIDILTKCLVDGYGAKLPLGWTRPFYDATNQAAAFRNSVADGGSGGYAKIFSDNSSNSNNALMRLTHSISMTDLSSLYNQGYTAAFRAETGAGAFKMDKWAIVGNSTAFYFFMSCNDQLMYSTRYNPSLFCGDFFSTIPNDAGRFIAVVSSENNGDTTMINTNASLDRLSLLSDNSRSPIKAFDADGFSSWEDYSIIHFLGQASGANIQLNTEPPHPAALSPILIWARNSFLAIATGTDRLGVLLQNSTLKPTFRGVMPGLSISLYSGWRTEPWPTILPLSDGNHWLFRNQNGPCRLMLNMEQWNDPFNQV